MNIQDELGMTALMWGSIGDDMRTEFIITGMIRTGGFKAKGWEEWIEIALICMLMEREIKLDKVKILVKNGADKTLRDKRGMSALSYAISNEDEEAIRILEGRP